MSLDLIEYRELMKEIEHISQARKRIANHDIDDEFETRLFIENIGNIEIEIRKLVVLFTSDLRRKSVGRRNKDSIAIQRVKEDRIRLIKIATDFLTEHGIEPTVYQPDRLDREPETQSIH